MGDLSPHFSRREFDCHDGTPAHPDPRLIDALEQLRRLIGNKPIRIVSGFRSRSWNAHVHGALHSQHLYNRAADIPHELGVEIDQARRAGFHGIGHCRGVVVHVDIRPTNSVVIFDDC